MLNKYKITAMLLFAGITACQLPDNASVNSNTLNQLLTESTIVDLTYSFSDETIYWVTAKEFELDTVALGMTDAGFFYAANNFCAAEHGGTHVDAPIHFAEGRQSVDEIPLETLMGRAVKVDISENALKDRDYLVSVEDLEKWEELEGTTISEGDIVLLQTGYGQFYPDKIKYLGTDMRGPNAVSELHFPGLSPEGAEWLIKRKIKAVGLDTPSIDYGQSTEFKTHVLLLGENIPAFENVANLDKLPATGFTVLALPMKIRDGSGGPLRIIALLPPA